MLLLAILAVRLSDIAGLPSLLFYLLLGVLLAGIGTTLELEAAQLAHALGFAALVVILAEGGLTTQWSELRPVIRTGAVLATLGVAVSIGVMTVAVHYVLGMGWQLALLLAAVTAPTDAAAVFSVLRRVPLPAKVVGALEAESGLNDAPVVIAVVALTSVVSGQEEPHAWWWYAAEAVYELAVGAAAGIVLAASGAAALRRTALPSPGLYPVAVLGIAVGAYAVADLARASGFLATYVCALHLGNARLPHRAATRGVAEAFGWLAQIGLFVLLGLLASPSQLPAQVLPALGAGVVLTLLARPASVLVSLLPFGFRLAECTFLSWAGLRGAVPIVLATVPVVAGVAGSERIFDLVVVLVTVQTLVQGPTLPWVARRLRLQSDAASEDLDVEVSPLGTLAADVVRVRVGAGSRLHGVEVFELRLPAGANVTLVAREGRTFVPGPRTALQRGDEVLVVTATAEREEVERRLQAISGTGKLADWHG